MQGWVATARRTVLTLFFFSSRRRHTRFDCDWSSDVCSSDLRRLSDAAAAQYSACRAARSYYLLFSLEPAVFVLFHSGWPPHHLSGADDFCRSEERRVGKECRSRWSPYH